MNSWPPVSAGECLLPVHSQQGSSPTPFQAPCHHSPSLLANEPSICFKKIPEITVCRKNSIHPPFPPRLKLTPSSYLYRQDQPLQPSQGFCSGDCSFVLPVNLCLFTLCHHHFNMLKNNSFRTTLPQGYTVLLRGPQTSQNSVHGITWRRLQESRRFETSPGDSVSSQGSKSLLLSCCFPSCHRKYAFLFQRLRSTDLKIQHL